jgi:hypothetical protein
VTRSSSRKAQGLQVPPAAAAAAAAVQAGIKCGIKRSSSQISDVKPAANQPKRQKKK